MATSIPFSVREFLPDFYEEAFGLWQRTPGMGLSAADEGPAITSFLDRNPGLSFLAQADGLLVGTILCGTDGRRGFLYHLAVAPKWRRHGLGKDLTLRSLAALRERGIDKCHLFVISDNELGQNFWTATGWTKRDDLVIFSRNLTDKGQVT